MNTIQNQNNRSKAHFGDSKENAQAVLPDVEEECLAADAHALGAGQVAIREQLEVRQGAGGSGRWARCGRGGLGRLAGYWLFLVLLVLLVIVATAAGAALVVGGR